MSELPSIGVLTVATNRYLDYWLAMAQSVEQHLFPGHPIVMHVFTDRVDDAREMARTLTRVQVDPVSIEPYGWPEATLLRYEVFNAHRDQIGEDVLLHLDADMLLVDSVGPELQPDSWLNGIALVTHPGFRRPRGAGRLGVYLRRPKLVASDLRLRSVAGGLGSWESDPRCLAYVPRELRTRYVCGGTWMGRAPELLSMISELAAHTRTDLDAGRIAIWHDESHLNCFASRNATSILGSEYCYAPGFANLRDLKPRIIAVDKGNERTR